MIKDIVDSALADVKAVGYYINELAAGTDVTVVCGEHEESHLFSDDDENIERTVLLMACDVMGRSLDELSNFWESCEDEW